MAKIGSINAQEHNGKSVLVGSLSTLQLGVLKFWLEDNPNRISLNAPAYNIFTKSLDGQKVSIGAAWEKDIIRGENAGSTFLSLTFDDPSFSEPLYVTAFQNKQGGWDVIWQRPRQNSKKTPPLDSSPAHNQQSTTKEATRELQSPAVSEKLDDEIPF